MLASDPHLATGIPDFGAFLAGSWSFDGPMPTFSTGSPLPGSSVNKGKK
jgi:hypothetical protein